MKIVVCEYDHIIVNKDILPLCVMFRDGNKIEIKFEPEVETHRIEKFLKMAGELWFTGLKVKKTYVE